MRKGIGGLAMLVQGMLHQHPFTGHLFVFRGRTWANLIWRVRHQPLFETLCDCLNRRARRFSHRLRPKQQCPRLLQNRKKVNQAQTRYLLSCD
jgi:transposase